jgi:hypothetical protein
MQPEGLGTLKKNPFTSSGLDPATFWLIIASWKSVIVYGTLHLSLTSAVDRGE